MDSKTWDQNHGFKRMNPKLFKKSHKVIILLIMAHNHWTKTMSPKQQV